MRVQHPIFQTPNAVELTLEERETPSSYANYEEGRALGETMDMWRVQTEGYTEGAGQLVGVVSRDAGFFDSPDTEWISGGVNSKGPNAVAIGRHGNFFHWGFAASPKYMTEEAKLVLVNSVHYIAQFDRKPPVARKKQGVMVRKSVTGAIERITDEGYARVLASYAGYRASDEKAKAKIRARKEAGETLTDRDEAMLTRSPMEDPGRFDPVRGFLSEDEWTALGEDVEKLSAYLNANLGFMHPTGDWYELGIDAELREFGVANNDAEFLSAALRTLDDPAKKDAATTLLKRYSQQSFSSREDWARWYMTNQEAFFFSETAGYVWLVDTQGQAAESAAGAAAGKPELAPTKQMPVDHAISAVEGDATHAVYVDFKVLKGWHMYGEVPASAAYVPVSLQWTLPEGASMVGDWDRPIGHPDAEAPGLTWLVDEVQFRCELKGVDTSKGPVEVVCQLRYQACNDRMCLRPASEELRVTLK